MRRRKTTPATISTGTRNGYDAYGQATTAKRTEPITETGAALDAGEELARMKFAGTALRIDGGRPYRVTEDDKIQTLEGYLLHPVSRRGEVKVYDAPSFVEYVNRFKSVASVVFSDKASTTFTAVLDYHRPGPVGDADWLRHRVSLPLRKTRQWLMWEAANKQPLNQATFAQFVEDNIPSIAEPPGAQLVEIVRTLQAKKDVTFDSNIQRQTDGSFRFNYSENVQGAAGARGDLKIPDVFKLALQPFEGATVYPVDARFRYRIVEGGKLSLWFELVRIDDILEHAFTEAESEIVNGIEDTFTVKGPAPEAVKAE